MTDHSCYLKEGFQILTPFGRFLKSILFYRIIGSPPTVAGVLGKELIERAIIPMNEWTSSIFTYYDVSFTDEFFLGMNQLCINC